VLNECAYRGGRSNGEFDGHERLVFPVVELQFGFVVMVARLQVIEDTGVNNAGKKVIDDDVLIMEANETLHILEGQARIVLKGPIMKSE